MIFLTMLPARAQDALPPLKIRIVEGEGAVYSPGSRATRGLTVEVTGQSGAPVSGASVGFVLPLDGASGTFVSGGRTETQTTGADGRATIWGMRWNKTSGPVGIRISAVKGPARGSAICTVQIDHSPAERQASGGGHKWMWIALAAAGAAGGGVAVVGMGGKTSAASAAVVTNPARIGIPTVSLEKP